MKSLHQIFLLLFLSFFLTACFHNDGDGVANYTIGGTVVGLEGTGLVLQNNDGDDIAISADGSFTFATPLANGSAYSVTVLTQPSSPNQICTVTNSSGTLSGGNVTNVSVTCVTYYTIGGSVAGLSGNGLVLQNNGADNLPITTNDIFTFATAIADGSDYNITVLSQPTGLSQTCAVSNGSGTVSGANVTNVAITCTTNTYSISGTVSGLAGTGLVLQNNSTDDLDITANGDFTFSSAITDGSGYSVSVLTQPTGLSQTCAVSNGSGTLSGTNVTNVAITCTTNIYSIGGAVSGLLSTGLVLQNNSGDDLSITTGGAFTFATKITDGNSYSVTILTQPTGQYCIISNNSGTVTGADVTNVSVECAQAHTNASLNGDYLFATTEIHDPGSNMTYCSVSGNMNFDGAGNLQVTTGTKRCKDSTDTITVTDISGATMTYSVNADGSFTYGSPSTHGQIVLDGNSLLLDSTLMGTNAGDYIDRGVAMKRVTAGSPPTYTDASLNGEYLLSHAEIYDPVSTTYCDEAGSTIMGGAGTATQSSTMRCSDGASITFSSGPGTLYYVVASDGSFTISDTALDPEPLHGQILLDSNSALMDTSLSATGGALMMEAVAMKRVTVGSVPTYSNTSLSGNYLFNYTEVYNPGTTTYCDQAGTLSFDSTGTVQSNGSMRCSDGTTVTTTTFSDTLDYDVASDGSFTLGGLVEPLHGQITLDGSSLLLDGTLIDTTATKLLNKGVAMKRTANEFVGTWTICRDEAPYDKKEVFTFDGSSGTTTSYLYTSTDGSCSAGEALNFSDTFTYTIGGAKDTTLLGVNVIATAVDLTFSGGAQLFQIFYVDNTSTPDNLYMGDETADPLLDGSTAEKRPIALQETLPRLRQ